MVRYENDKNRDARAFFLLYLSIRSLERLRSSRAVEPESAADVHGGPARLGAAQSVQSRFVGLIVT